MVSRDKLLRQDGIDRELEEAGWETDGSFSEHLSIGEWGSMCVLVHRSTWEKDEPAYEIYDTDKHVSCWVRKVPTPEEAATLLEEHGRPPEEKE